MNNRLWFSRSALLLLGSASVLACGGGDGGAAVDGLKDEAESGVAPSQPTALSPEAQGRLSDLGVACNLVDSDAGYVSMRLHNAGTRAVLLLERGTAWDEGASVFTVTSDGAGAAKYLGTWASRGPVLDEEYLRLEPGETQSVTYPVAQRYGLSPGVYRASLAQATIRTRVGDQDLLLQHDCNSTGLSFTQVPEELGNLGQAYTYSSCTAGETARFEDIKVVGRATLDAAFPIVNSDNPIYERFFGAWTSGRGSAVTAVLTSVRDTWDAQNIVCGNATCTANPTWIAYVGGTCGANNVCICDPFWTEYPAFVGQDFAQSSTLIHELTHLVGGTGDNSTWGMTNAEALAISNPATAVDTAACFEYFTSVQYSGLAYVASTMIL